MGIGDFQEFLLCLQGAKMVVHTQDLFVEHFHEFNAFAIAEFGELEFVFCFQHFDGVFELYALPKELEPTIGIDVGRIPEG